MARIEHFNQYLTRFGGSSKNTFATYDGITTVEIIEEETKSGAPSKRDRRVLILRIGVPEREDENARHEMHFTPDGELFQSGGTEPLAEETGVMTAGERLRSIKYIIDRGDQWKAQRLAQAASVINPQGQ